MKKIKNWDKLTEFDQYVTEHMIDFLENGGQPLVVCDKISKNGMVAEYMVFFPIGETVFPFSFEVIQKINGEKKSYKKTFRILGCESLLVLMKIKNVLKIKNKTQNYGYYCYAARDVSR